MNPQSLYAPIAPEEQRKMRDARRKRWRQIKQAQQQEAERKGRHLWLFEGAAYSLDFTSMARCLLSGLTIW